MTGETGSMTNEEMNAGDVVACELPADRGAAAAAGHDCDGCALARTRRDFLREGAIAALGIFASLGIGSRAAAALPVSAARLIRSTRETKTYAIPAADGAQIDNDAQVILVRWEGKVYAFNLSCPHQNTALRWNDGEHRFQCPKHHSQYQPDGTFITGRATRGMDRFPITKNGGNVVVDIDNMIKQTDNMAAWQAAFVTV